MADPAPANDASLDEDEQIHRLWRKGFDTVWIARAVKRPEYEIANRLPDILKRYRQMTGGGR